MAGTGSHRGFAFVDFTTKQDAKVKIWMILFKIMFWRFCWKCFEEFDEKALEDFFEKGPCNVSKYDHCLWSVRKALIFDTQNPEISGFSTAHAYNKKPNGKQKWSETAEKWHFCWLVTRYPCTRKA